MNFHYQCNYGWKHILSSELKVICEFFRRFVQGSYVDPQSNYSDKSDQENNVNLKKFLISSAIRRHINSLNLVQYWKGYRYGTLSSFELSFEPVISGEFPAINQFHINDMILSVFDFICYVQHRNRTKKKTQFKIK